MVALISGLALCIAFSILAWVVEHKPYKLISGTLAAITMVIGLALYPVVNVWQKQLSGEANLREAEWDRQIRIEEANAEKEAAELDADAEVIRARGVKEANEIIAGGLGGPEGYLRYLYIQAISKASMQGNSQFVYLPTEAGLPILEAGRSVSAKGVQSAPPVTGASSE